MTLMDKDYSAVVIGGSIAGLLAARVLADYFPKVTIIESDNLPLQPHARKGVPQSVQPHVLLAKGYRILEELFPGIGDELVQAGALSIDWAREFHHYSHGGWNAIATTPSDVISLTCSRPLIEWSIRRRLAQLANVDFLDGKRVTGLGCDRSTITGVYLQSSPGSPVEKFPAAFVADASGRRSQTPKWLQSQGFTPPTETIINPLLGYATRRYRSLDNQPEWKVMLVSQSPPHNPRLGYLAQIENGEWIATLGGYGRDYPPVDDQGFLEFARSLASPRFYEAIKNAEPISPIYAHRATANRLRHYDKIELPHNFVVLGDAVCALCPVYGQGMTVSALSAMVLRKWLRKEYTSSGVLKSSAFQKKLAKNNSLHWSLATSQDSLFLTTQGRREVSNDGLLNWYTNRLLQLTNSDPHAHTQLIQIVNLLRSPLQLYHPKVIFRVVTTPNQRQLTTNATN